VSDCLFKLTDAALTVEEVGEKFAREYWPQPREIEEWGLGRFRLVNGTAWYVISWIAEDTYNRGSWIITRETP